VLLNQVAATKDYQEILEKDILRASHKSFCQVVILGAATFQPFMRLPAAQRREVIEDLLDLQVFTAMNTSLREKAQENASLLSKKTSERYILEETLELFKKHQNLLVEEKTKKREELRKETIDLTLCADRYKEGTASLSEQLAEEEVLNRKFEKLWRVKQDIAYNRDRLLGEIEFLESKDTCPTCAQIIDHTFKHSEIEAKKTRVLELDGGLSELKQKHGELALKLAEFTKIKEKINEYKIEIEIIRTQVTSNAHAIRKIDEELSSSEVNDIFVAKKALASVTSEIEALNKNKELMDVASVLLKDSGVKAEIIKQYVPVINKYINKYLSEFELSCRFELDETFTETISWSSHRDIFSYESFSQGERQGIDLSILFAWRAIAKLRNTINTNLLILDEVFDTSLDYMAIDFLMNIIRIFSLENNVIVISHKDQMNDRFEHIIKVEKYRNFSRISKA